jgi:hypothetical protein
MEQKSIMPLALGAAAVVAAIEYPVSQHYATVPPTDTGKRMAIAAAMAFAGVVVANWFLQERR